MDSWIWMAIGGWLLIGSLAFYWLITKKMTESRAACLLITAGFLLRFTYVLYTPVTLRQHDVYSFSGAKGHAGYIMHFYKNLRLPDFSPDSVSQFYHPPLHHFLEALWMRLQTALGLSLPAAAENTQLLTLLYSSLCLPVVFRILKQMQFKGVALWVPLSIFCFHPTFIIMAGSINNDILMTLLTLTAFWTALRWYQTPTLKRILPVAFSMGFAMMAKFSAALAAPAIGLLFIMRLVSDLQQNNKRIRRILWRRYLLQFAAFALICCPLGLWWSLYSYFVWNVPFGYVPSLSLSSQQYIGYHSLWQRLFITKDQLSSVYIAWGDQPGHDYYEYNILTGLLKTSVFDESTLFLAEGLTGIPRLLALVGIFFSVILFYHNAILILFSIAAFILCLIRRLRLVDAPITNGVLCLGLVVLLSYFSFCLGYPHTCTQNFRYAIPSLLTGCLFLGRFLQDLTQRPPTLFSRGAVSVITFITGIFFASSAVVYFLLGIQQ